MPPMSLPLATQPVGTPFITPRDKRTPTGVERSNIANQRLNKETEASTTRDIYHRLLSLKHPQIDIEAHLAREQRELTSTMRQEIWLSINGEALCSALRSKHYLCLGKDFSWDPAHHPDEKLGITLDSRLSYLRKQIEFNIDAVFQRMEKPHGMAWGNKICTFARWEYLKDEILPLYRWFKKQGRGVIRVQREMSRRYGPSFTFKETKVREKITEWTQGENRRGTMHPSPSTQSTWTEPETPQSVNTTGGTPFLLDIHTNNTQSPTNNMDICDEVPIVSPLRVSSRGTNHEDDFSRDDQDLDMESVTSHCSKAESAVSTMTESIDDAVGQGFKNWDDSTFNDLIDEVPTPQDADQITEGPYRPHRDPVDSGIVLDDDDYDIEGSSDPHSTQAAQVPRNKSPKSRPGPVPQVPQPLLFLAQNPYLTPALNRNPFSPKSIKDLHHYVALQDLSQATEPPSQHFLEGRQLETASFSKVSQAHPVPQGFSHVAQPIPRNITQPSQPSRSALHELALNIYSESHSHESTIHRLKEALIHHDPNDNFDAYCNTPGHVALLKPLHRMQAEVTTLHWLTTWLNSLYIQNFIDEPNYDGDTILHLAARNGFHLVVQELLRRDANPFCYNKLGSCPMDECLTQTRPEDGAAAVDFTKRYDCVKMLEAAMAALKC